MTLISVIRETLEAMDINVMTPLEALNKVQELKKQLEESRDKGTKD